MKQWKIRCKANQNVDCLAHIFEQNCNNLFDVWYGILEVSSLVELMSLQSNDKLVLLFEDGRVGGAAVLGSDSTFGNDPTDPPLSKEIYMLFVVGISSIKIP